MSRDIPDFIISERVKVINDITRETGIISDDFDSLLTGLLKLDHHLRLEGYPRVEFMLMGFHIKKYYIK